MKMLIFFILFAHHMLMSQSAPMSQSCILCQDFNRKNKEPCARVFEECGKCLDGFVADENDPKICYAIEILENPISTTALIAGSDIELTCLFNSPVLCVWERNGQHVSVGAQSRYQFKEEGVNEENESYDCALKIRQLSQIDVGQWQCSNRANSYINSIKSQIANIIITVSNEEVSATMAAMRWYADEPHIYFENKLADQTNLNYQEIFKQNEENSVITCIAQNVAEIMWKINGQNVIKKFAAKTLQLNIKEIESFTDSSDWKNIMLECVIENEGEVTGSNYVIVINDKDFSNLKVRIESVEIRFRTMNIIYATFFVFITLSFSAVFFTYYFLHKSNASKIDVENKSLIEK